MIRANNQPGPRRRKALSKSRRGCRNCKLRKVKCDEAWPHCKACDRYGVLCNYQPTAPDLQMPHENQDVTLALGSKGAMLSTGSIDNQVIRLLVRFQACTVESILKVRPETILALAHSRPYLMHSILSLSATHERYQRSLPIAETPSVFETYHFTQSLALFNQQLSAQQLVDTQDWDALWLTATFLGILTFALIHYSSTTRQREIWPLAPSNQEDLEWLNMAQGKKAIWNLIQPLGPKSLLWSMNEEYTKMHAESHPHQLLQQQRTNDIQVAPLTLLKLCNITPTSSPDNNPYFTALQALLRLNQRGEDARDAAMAVVVGCSRASLLAFTSQMKDSFRDLLWLKDPIALLLLALWYEKVGREIWWTRARAMVEARSIQRYLQRYHKDHVVVGLLPDLLAY